MTQDTHQTLTEFSGKIALAEGYVFNYMIGGERCPEVYGFTVAPDGSVLKGSGGWFRTQCPREASRTAHWNLYGDGLVSACPAPRS